MADLEHQPAVPCQALHQLLDEELQSPDAQAFPDASQARR
jgi:hypothetical protein